MLKKTFVAFAYAKISDRNRKCGFSVKHKFLQTFHSPRHIQRMAYLFAKNVMTVFLHEKRIRFYSKGGFSVQAALMEDRNRILQTLYLLFRVP